MLEGLEWIGGGARGDGGIGMDARWEEGIGRTSHTLELQELGGYPCKLSRILFSLGAWRGPPDSSNKSASRALPQHCWGNAASVAIVETWHCHGVVPC